MGALSHGKTQFISRLNKLCRQYDRGHLGRYIGRCLGRLDRNLEVGVVSANHEKELVIGVETVDKVPSCHLVLVGIFQKCARRTPRSVYGWPDRRLDAIPNLALFVGAIGQQ